MWGLVQRWVAHQRIGRTVDVWYHPDYAPPALVETARGSSLDLNRGSKIIMALAQDKLLDPEQVRRPDAATVAELSRFHTFPYLESTSDPHVIGRIFGLNASQANVEPVLRASLRGTGGTLAASRDVVRTDGKVAFNLGGGYHHAHADLGAGFCVHNDVAVALANLRAEGFGGRVLIVDLDYHQGDGYLECYADDPTVVVYSIHGSVWSHLETKHPQIHLSGRVSDAEYLRALRQTLPSALNTLKPDLLYYVAGNDVLAGDALGTFQLTLEGVLERDMFVYDAVQLRNTPMVVMMAGGYSPEAWRATHAMLRYALTGYAQISLAVTQSLRGRFNQVAAMLDPVELQQEDSDPFVFSAEDLDGSLFGPPKGNRLLDFYSDHGVEVVMTKYGVFDTLRQRGFDSPRLSLDTSDRSRQVVRVFGRRGAGREVLLLELVVRRQWMPDPSHSDRRIEVLYIEWLLMQDPTRSFSLARPPLPGQSHPGLGGALQVLEMLRIAATRLRLDGLLNRPAYFHTALRAHEFMFIDPAKEGVFQALKSHLSGPIDDFSRALHDGRVTWGDGEVVAWDPAPRILPLSDALVEWFAGSTYQDAVTAGRQAAEARGIKVQLEGEGVPSPPIAT